MPRIAWHEDGDKIYELGVDRGVLYVRNSSGGYDTGVPWNGLVGVTNSPEGAENNDQYADNMVYASIQSAEKAKGTIEAFTYPDEFAVCDGSAEPVAGIYLGQQTRVPFGLAYRTIVGNDTQGNNYGEKIHLVYGAIAAPSEKAHNTINDSPEAMTFSWEFNASPVHIEGYKPTATLTIDSTKVSEDLYKQFLDIIYGSDSSESKLPTPKEVIEHFQNSIP